MRRDIDRREEKLRVKQDEDKENLQIMINCVQSKAVEQKEGEVEKLKVIVQK